MGHQQPPAHPCLSPPAHPCPGPQKAQVQPQQEPCRGRAGVGTLRGGHRDLCPEHAVLAQEGGPAQHQAGKAAGLCPVLPTLSSLREKPEVRLLLCGLLTQKGLSSFMLCRPPACHAPGRGEPLRATRPRSCACMCMCMCTCVWEGCAHGKCVFSPYHVLRARGDLTQFLSM